MPGSRDLQTASKRKIIRYYQPALRFALNHRYSTLASFTGVLIVMLMLVSSGWTRFVFFPVTESETATATLVMPVGTPFEVTARHTDRVLEAAFDLQDKYADYAEGGLITDIFSSTGSSGRSNGTHLATVRFETAPVQDRDQDISTTELINEWRSAVGLIPGAETMNYRASFFRPGDPIDVQFSGNSLESLNAIGEELKEQLATYPGVFEIADSLSDGKEELRIELSPQGHLVGLTRSDIVNQVGQAFRGLEAQRIQRGRDDIRVLVRYPIDERDTLASLSEMLITAPNGRLIPLSNVATLAPGKGPSVITRIDRFRVLNVTADVDKDNTNMTVLQADLNDYINSLLTKYPGITFKMEGEQRQQRESFGSLQSGLIILLFVIYALLALPLKSYVQPLIVMSVIPFGIIGAIIGHWIMGQPLSFLSSLGLMALMGVVINDSLVLVDYINQQHRAGDAASACRQACRGGKIPTRHADFIDHLLRLDPVVAGTLIDCCISRADGNIACFWNPVCNHDHAGPGANQCHDRRRYTPLLPREVCRCESVDCRRKRLNPDQIRRVEGLRGRTDLIVVFDIPKFGSTPFLLLIRVTGKGATCPT